MKKVLLFVFLLTFSVVLVGCGNDEEQQTVVLKFGGSTSVEEAIQLAADAFKAEVANFDYEMNQTGSGDGHKRTLGSEKDNNPAHIGFASREFKSSEDVAGAMNSGKFALDAIAMVVHKDSQVSNLTSEQVLKIYTGEITNWSEIDSSLSGAIAVYTRDAESGTRGAFQEILGFEDVELVETSIVTSGNGDLATKVGQNVNGIGYVSLSTDFEANNIKAVKYNNVEASKLNTNNGTYTLARPFMFTTRAANDFATEAEKEMTKAFIAYLGTKDAVAVMNEAGVIIDDSNAPTWASIRDQYPITKN